MNMIQEILPLRILLEVASVIFKLLKCNNAYKFLSKIDCKQWHSHPVNRDLPKKLLQEKPAKRGDSPLSLFHCINSTVYNTR